MNETSFQRSVFSTQCIATKVGASNLTGCVDTTNVGAERLANARAYMQTLFAQEIFVSNIKEGEENYDLAEKEDIERFGIQVHDLITAIGTLLGDRIGCSIGNVAASTIGSFDLHWELEQYDNNGDAVVRIKMTNPMSAGSFLKPSMIGYSDFWRNHKISSQISEFFNSNANKSGMLHTVNMTMTWTTTIKNPNR